MSDRMSAAIFNPQQGWQVFNQAWQHAKSLLMAGHRLSLEIKPEKRNLPQNAKLHATLTEIAEQREWAGKKRDPETWKRLMVAAWCRARGEAVELLPAIDGQGVDIVMRKTSTLTVAECSELIEFVLAWAANEGIEVAER